MLTTSSLVQNRTLPCYHKQVEVLVLLEMVVMLEKLEKLVQVDKMVMVYFMVQVVPTPEMLLDIVQH